MFTEKQMSEGGEAARMKGMAWLSHRQPPLPPALSQFSANDWPRSSNVSCFSFQLQTAHTRGRDRGGETGREREGLRSGLTLVCVCHGKHSVRNSFSFQTYGSRFVSREETDQQLLIVLLQHLGQGLLANAAQSFVLLTPHLHC